MKTTPTSIVGCFGEKAFEKIEKYQRAWNQKRACEAPCYDDCCSVVSDIAARGFFISYNLFLSKEFVVQILQFVTKYSPKYNHKLFIRREYCSDFNVFEKVSFLSQPLWLPYSGPGTLSAEYSMSVLCGHYLAEEMALVIDIPNAERQEKNS